MMKVEYYGREYLVYGSCALLGNFYFILWNEHTKEFFEADIKRCKAI